MSPKTLSGKGDSLPLMGIGNFVRRDFRFMYLVLITPHGDRKHAGEVLREAARILLITPHGDRKPGRPF